MTNEAGLLGTPDDPNWVNPMTDDARKRALSEIRGESCPTMPPYRRIYLSEESYQVIEAALQPQSSMGDGCDTVFLSELNIQLTKALNNRGERVATLTGVIDRLQAELALYRAADQKEGV